MDERIGKGRRMLCNHCPLVLNADLHYQLKDALRTGYQFPQFLLF
ncbi:hypothetical protein SynROS8604_02100 [Synechococcus sp. ROS8604]|nr:hypothetical protein SynROS8604_02100 [Synechococcus sp. ROS8604]